MPWLRIQLQTIAKTVDGRDDSYPTKPPVANGRYTSTRRAAFHARVSSLRSRPASLPGAERADLLANLRTKEWQFEEAANLALGMESGIGPGTPDGRPMAANLPTGEGDVLAAVIADGKPFLLRATLSQRQRLAVGYEAVRARCSRRLAVRAVHGQEAPKRIGPGDVAQLTFRVSPPLDAQPTKAYFHRDNPETDAIYKIDDPKYVTLALPPPPVAVRVEYSINGSDGVIRSFARTPMHDDKGDVWSMPLAVVPPFSVAESPATQIIVARPNPSAQLNVVVRTTADRGSGTVHPEAPPAWTIAPKSANVAFTGPGQQTADFKELPDGARESRYDVRALLNAGGRDYTDGYSLVARPDLGGFFYYQPALQRASIVNVKVPQGLKVGYTMGAGDDIPDVLRELGLDVTMLTPDEVATGDLSRYGTIVLGIRAYDTREDVKQNNQRLLDYVKNGGTLLVQYNTSPADFNAGHYMPYPAQLSRERVTVEEAPVTILDPQSPVFHYPNQISERDFEGWIQERGLYFMDEWDAHYTPLLASNDPGEPPQKGGLLVAQYGKGSYIYTGYAFFRQLPFGVPGAIRLYVNLLSVGHEPH